MVADQSVRGDLEVLALAQDTLGRARDHILELQHADGWWQDAFLYARAYTIAGGANEVLKTVVAERALGLPREQR